MMGLTAEDTRHQAISRDDEEANISTSSSIDNSSNEDSNNTIYRNGSSGEDSSDCRSSSSSDKEDRSRHNILQQQQQQCQRLMLLRRREGLLDITMRTVNLMRRNQQLQHRLAALQAETRAFVRSVLSNPENQAIRILTSRVRRKSRTDDDDDNNISKKLKTEDSMIIINTPNTLENPTARIEQDPAISESDIKEK